MVEAGLAKLQPSDRCDHGLAAPSTSGSTSSSTSMAPLPHFNDILLLRVQAQLLLALSDANRAVAVLGTAVRRLAHARRALEARPSLAGGVAAQLVREQEAQVSVSQAAPSEHTWCTLLRRAPWPLDAFPNRKFCLLQSLVLRWPSSWPYMLRNSHAWALVYAKSWWQLIH